MVRVGGPAPGFSGTISSFVEIFRQREMLGLLVRRDLKARYKDSALGFVWTLVRPITQLVIYYVVLGNFLGAARGIPDFAVYIFTGLVAYGLFSEIVVGATASIVGNGGLIKKIYLPREIFPLASVGSSLFNFMIQLVILIAATIAVGHFPWTIELLFAIPSLLILVLYGTAFGFLLSAANVYLRDIGYLVEVIILIMFWASPVVYSWQIVRDQIPTAWMLEVYTNNPVTLAVLGFQRAFWTSGHDIVEYPSELLLRQGVAIFVGLILLVAFQRVFARLQGNFAQEL
ncbi:ABC transporter permease [Marisediminicola senii]|uniref:ABC transporter permease n=1 Tax=Marisediminicola senii TaxID=2711233 RepID=UPI0013EC8CED